MNDRITANQFNEGMGHAAFSSILLNTGSSSPGDELMTCNTSDVAVC